MEYKTTYNEEEQLKRYKEALKACSDLPGWNLDSAFMLLKRTHKTHWDNTVYIDKAVKLIDKAYKQLKEE